jgi:hypothetical protein
VGSYREGRDTTADLLRAIDSGLSEIGKTFWAGMRWLRARSLGFRSFCIRDWFRRLSLNWIGGRKVIAWTDYYRVPTLAAMERGVA